MSEQKPKQSSPCFACLKSKRHRNSCDGPQLRRMDRHCKKASMNACRRILTAFVNSAKGLVSLSHCFHDQPSRPARVLRITLLLLLVSVAPGLEKGNTLSAREQAPEGSKASPLQAAANRQSAYRQRLADDPNDLTALRVLAALETQQGDFAEAIRLYRRVLQLIPSDRESKIGLARVLNYHGDYQEAVGICETVLALHPSDTEALVEMARAYIWSERAILALPILQSLADNYPSNPDYGLDLARAKAREGDYPGARATLAAVLSTDPDNHDARVQLAYVDILAGHYRDALLRFNQLIRQDPTDSDALLGNARIAYYRGDLEYAHQLVAKLVGDRPNDLDTILLLASLERALHHREKARKLLTRAQQLAPGNNLARELAQDIRDESRITLHTSASFAREITTGNANVDPAELGDEDLRTFGYETTLGFSALPRSDSFLSLYYLPSNSPAGGLRGTVAPAQFLYRQTTYLFPHLTLRGGLGLTRFGPGELAEVPTQTEPIQTASIRPLGFLNLTYAPRKKASIDLTAARSAINYTPTAVRLGVMENRLSGRLNYFFNRRTELHLDTFYAGASSACYEHVTVVNGTTRARTTMADHDQGLGGSLSFNRNLIQTYRIKVDLGYSGLAYGYTGRRHHTYMGFFNPSFYQRHYVTTRIKGQIRGPVGFDFSGGIGLQQVEQGTALTRAMILSPAITLKTSSRATITLGYVYYDSAQSLGLVRGNAVKLSTDWKF